jgi:hypothetical protein
MRYGRDDRGVAMITVLFVGAALTVMATTAAFSTIKEMRSSTDDRKSAEALSYAEAGVDRFLQYLRVGDRKGLVTWHKMISAGCEVPDGLTLPVGNVASGEFTAVLKVFEPNPPSGDPADRYAPGACDYRASQANDPQGQSFIITSKGTHPAAKRVVQQVVKVTPLGLPIGIYAETVDAGGTPDMFGISMFTEGQIRGREKLEFVGDDPYYFMSDFFPDGVTGRSMTEHVPAAAHALGGIYQKQNGSQPEFPGPTDPTTRNCTANANAQSLWDSDGSAATGTITTGCSGQVGYPNTSRFTPTIMDNVRPHELTEQDHQALRDAAKTSGIYCSIGATTSCTRAGTPMTGIPGVWQDGDVAPLFAEGINNFVVYFDYLTGDTLTNQIKWHADVWGCNDTDPDLNKSVVIVVRRGGIEFQDAQLNGAFIMDGELRYTGNPVLNGTIISQSGFSINGTADFTLDSCWVKNMPGPFLTSAPTAWSEIDR